MRSRTPQKSKMMCASQFIRKASGSEAVTAKVDLGLCVCSVWLLAAAEVSQVLLQYWDGDDEAERVEKCLVRKTWG